MFRYITTQQHNVTKETLFYHEHLIYEKFKRLIIFFSVKILIKLIKNNEMYY